MEQDNTLRLILHAPTASALERARRNAVNLRRESPGAEVRIIVNGRAVAAALEAPHLELDRSTWLCPNTLARLGRENRPPLRVLGGAAVLEIARLQQVGWLYIRA